MRWLLLDEVVSVQKKVKAKSLSHVPDVPVSPEVLLIEMMAQTGGLLVGAETDFQEDLIFVKIEKAEFYHPFGAGEPLEIETVSDHVQPAGAWIDGTVQSGNRTIAKARFLLMNAGPLLADKKEPISFHRAFMEHFKIREKVT